MASFTFFQIVSKSSSFCDLFRALVEAPPAPTLNLRARLSFSKSPMWLASLRMISPACFSGAVSSFSPVRVKASGSANWSLP